MPQPLRVLLAAFSLALMVPGCSERKQAGPPATAADEVASPAAADSAATESPSSSGTESAQ